MAFVPEDELLIKMNLGFWLKPTFDLVTIARSILDLFVVVSTLFLLIIVFSARGAPPLLTTWEAR